MQIIKKPIDNKGPKLTSKITFVGRYVILLPFKQKTYISNKIKKKNKKRLIKVKSYLPENIGCIIRTKAYNKGINIIKLEINILLKVYNKIFLKLKKKRKKKIYKNNNIIYDLLKENKIKYLICNNLKLCIYIKLFLYIFKIKIIEKIKYYNNKNLPIFIKYKIEKQIELLFNKYIYISNKVNLIIEETETLNVIDINSANNENKAYKINLIAIKEITRQIILRNLGGIIIIDCIDMKTKKERKKIYKILKKNMEKDKKKHKIYPPTKLNLIQITRERDLIKLKYYKKKKNKYIYNYINNIEIELLKYIKLEKKIYLHVNPIIANYLKYGFFSYRMKWYFKYKKWIKIISRFSFNFFKYKLFN
ncbi:MAG: ribonuclease E/G [Candidatus Shikimatogenerans bostrichidophilus]|nr:MAG: ribonuclease E/G [Candidatus Shikimatogenerans bostrichidophilus]